MLDIARSTLYLWVKFYKCKPNYFSAKQFRLNKHNKFNALIVKYICEYVLTRNNFNMKTLRKYLKQKFNVSISKSYIYYILKQNNITRKRAQIKTIPKNKSYANTKSDLLKNINEANPETLISVDESSFLLCQPSNYSWSASDKRQTLHF